MTFPTIKLPARPLAIKRGTISTPFVYYFSIPILLAIAVFMMMSEAPGILRDYTISQNPVFVDGMIDGSCKTRKAVFTTCEVDLSYEQGGQRYDKDVEIMFVDIHSGDYETGLVVSGDHPELATITLGLDMLWNRIITLSVFTVLLGGGGLVMIFMLLRFWRVSGQLSKPAPLTVVPVEITGMDTKRNRLNVTYADRVSERKTKRVAFTRFERGQEPIIVGDAGSNLVALAVWHGNTSLPVLLDDRLERIEMTEQERAAALAPLHELAQSTDHASATSHVVPEKQGMSLARRAGGFALVLLLLVGGIFGYWLWYVTSAPSQYNSPGMDINNMMPEALNRWGCDQLKSRFGDGNAPFGCTAPDHISWK
ncbi:hypothetical protein B5M44_08450 [Shinella sumterensis]|uniref:hypothetical protein n=1 Tax=Shinella sumterensis TaxID=1967501 RepID=UPI00106ECA07|nr:hypothetical protein [Shinella sumterensis]MCD1262784.1 hypothetical protein [Shinella sumterensis]TFE98903.1 hypothetical protein B5M44_08450 [Shinella sumterensis]